MSVFFLKSEMPASYQKRIDKAAYDIAVCLRGSAKVNSFNIVIAAYLLYKTSKYCKFAEVKYQDILAGAIGIRANILNCACEMLNDTSWEWLKKLLAEYSADELAQLVISYDLSVEEKGKYMYTPISVNRLAQSVLNIAQNDNVADICCGCGNFLNMAVLAKPNARYYGYEINEKNKLIADIRAELLGADMSINLANVFSLGEDKTSPRFNKIFSNYPFGIKYRNLGNGEKIFVGLSQKIPGLSKGISSDWLFNTLIYNLLADNGRAIGIMTNGSTCNSIDEPIRQYFVEQGMIEAVIALPPKMFSYTNIATTMIVLSKGNKAVRMVDATNICQQGRRFNEFSEDDIQRICSDLQADSEISRLVDVDKLRTNNYALNLSRYLEQNYTLENAIVFGDVIKSISRGAPCTASQLDEMAAKGETNMRYLMLANINDGVIDDNLPYLANIEPKFEKYCLKNNSLIISKNGLPYKIVVASVKDGQKILASGNLYIIELDTTRVDPYYLKAFFDSEHGEAVLKSISVGAVVLNIGVESLKKIMVPILPLEEQQKIAQEYKAKLAEIADIKSRLAKELDSLHQIFK